MDVISPKSHIWSKVEKDTLLNTLFIQGKATSGTLPNNSGKSIIDQMASLLCGDMDRERPVCDGGGEIGLFLMVVSNHVVLIGITALQLQVSSETDNLDECCYWLWCLAAKRLLKEQTV